MNREELQSRMRELSEPPADSRPPLWDYWRHDLYSRVVEGLDPYDFFNWPCVYHTMLTRHWPGATKIEYGRIMEDRERFESAIVAPMLGNLQDYYIRPFSSNLIHQAHHIYQWMKNTGLHVSDLESVFEFGGGYGAMALVMRRLGFEGTYYIYDLPEFALLQEYYLSNVGIDGVKWVTEPGGLVQLPAQDLIIACFSLSEVDLELRFQVLKHVSSESYLFLYSASFEDYKNTRYFSSVVPEYFSQMNWVNIRADHLPDDNYYAFGYRNDSREP